VCDAHFWWGVHAARMNEPLTNQRRKVAAAELALTRARDELRAAAKREGLPTAGIFSESEYVLRASADRWAVRRRMKAGPT